MGDAAFLAGIVDLERYPIADPASPQGRALVDDCHRQLDETGVCLLPGFIRPAPLSSMIGEACALAPHAHHTDHWRSVDYELDRNPDDPAPRATRASIGAVAYDRLTPDAPLRGLYESDEFTAFIAAALNARPLYRCADPLTSCMLTVAGSGDELGWHYDANDGVVSLLLQSAASGGGFEFAPGSRDHGAATLDMENAIMDGGHKGVVRLPLEPGTLSLFNGHHSLHRVTPVGGDQPRIIALFSYSDEPDYVFSDKIHRNFFGR